MSHICYAPNAVPVPEYGPCNNNNNNNNNTDSVSLCCSPGQYCLTNGLCANGEGEFYSGACTDKTYRTAICPSFCMGASKFVVQCKDSAIPDGDFCCDANGSGSCCNSAGNALDLAVAVTSATVEPTTNFGLTASTSSFRSLSSSSILGESTLSSTAFSTRPPMSSAVGLTGANHGFDSTSTSSVPSTMTATLVSVYPSPSPTPFNKGVALGLEISLPVAGVLIILVTLTAVYYRVWRKSRSERSFTVMRSRIVDYSSNSEIKVEPIELATNPTRPAELESASTLRAPTNAPGLSASHENVARLARIPASVPWDVGHFRAPSPATPTVRPNNPQGPLPLPVIPTISEDDSRGSLPPAGSAIAQTDGGSTPQPRLELAGSAAPPTQGPTMSSSSGEALERNVSSDGEASDGNVLSDGIRAPPNSEAPSSTLINSSPPSTRSYDSNTKTILDVGIVLHTAETESEQGDVSPSSLADEEAEENELSQYLNVVGWQPRHEAVATVVGGSEDADSEVKTIRSALSEPVGGSGDSGLVGLPVRGRSI